MRTTVLPAADPTTGLPVVWTSTWETSLDARAHEAIAALLARSYPASTTDFSRGRSWAGARPELRVLGHRDGELVGHAGMVRRFVRAPDHGASLLVGDVGLVAVHPGHQGTGLGAALMDTVAGTLADLGLPHGFLTCDPHVRPFYERCGWTHLGDHVVRSVRIDHTVEDHRRHGMLLPVRRPVGDWPSGRIVRDGQEI
jgi:nodulation protein A